MATELEIIRELGGITTRDEGGRHFLLWANHWEELERRGWIAIDRPVHDATGIPYSQEHWALEVTAEGQQVVDEHLDEILD